MIDTEILQDYSSEARELLDEMDSSLIRLEKDGVAPELLNSVFRAVHCIKGSAEYIGLERSGTLTHGVENLLDRLREGILPLTPGIIDFLFRAKDLIAHLITEVERDHEEKTEISEIMNELDRHLGRTPTGPRQIPGEELVEETPGETPAAPPSLDESVVMEKMLEEAEEPAPPVLEEPYVTVPYDAEIGQDDSFIVYPEDLQMDYREEELAQEETILETAGPDVFEESSLEELEEHPEAGFGLGSEAEAGEPSVGLDDTLTFILNIALYLDDLQDGLNSSEAFSQVVGNLEKLKGMMKIAGPPEAVGILELMEARLGLVESDPSSITADEVEALRALLHDLRPYYPEHLFPLEQRKSPEEEEAAPAPSAWDEELSAIAGLDRDAIQALLATGITSMEQVAETDLDTLRRIRGLSESAARTLLAAAGVSVTPPAPAAVPPAPVAPSPPPAAPVAAAPAAPKPVPIRPTEERSLLADVDDELLREFEGIFGSESKPHPGAAQAGSTPAVPPGSRAEDLLRELDIAGEDVDREIMEIFLSYGYEVINKLTPVVEKINAGTSERQDWDTCAELIKQIRSSSTYMDYQSLASFLDEWYERSLWASDRAGSLSSADLAFMEENRLRFQDFLVGLEGALNPQKAAGLAQTMQREVIPPPGVEAAPPRPAQPAPRAPGKEVPSPPQRQVPPPPAPPEPAAAPITAEPARSEVRAKEREVPLAAMPPAADLVPRHAAEAADAAPAIPGGATLAPEAEAAVQPDLTQESALVKTMRVDAAKVDLLLNQVGELVVNRSYVEQLSNELKTFQKSMVSGREIGKKEIALVKDLTLKWTEASLSLGRVATDIQEGVMKLRMLPVGQLFNRMPRLIRDLSRRVGKQVSLEVFGGDTEVDKRVIEQIYNPLVHLIRNAVDHGIEDADTRKDRDKNLEGSITLRAYSEGNQVVIDVEDDGGGINSEAVIARAVQNRLLDAQEAGAVSSEQVYNFLFLPGFSTSQKVTRTSGRGVGMDVVKKDVEKINGHIEIESWETKGTRISIKIPLTLAIIQTLLIEIGKHTFAVPLTAVREIIQVSPREIITIEGFEVIKFRDETIPVLRINELFRLNDVDSSREMRYLVIAMTGNKTVGLLVEDLIGEQDVVIKPLAEHVCEVRGLAGSTILGNGTIALVLDITEMVEDVVAYQRAISAQPLAYGKSGDLSDEPSRSLTI